MMNTKKKQEKGFLFFPTSLCVLFSYFYLKPRPRLSRSLSLSPPPPLLVRRSRRELEMKERRRNKVLRCIEKERTPAGKGEARRSEARQ